jgi:2-phosphosulfolactate phosphatase
MSADFGQRASSVRFDWGPVGAAAIAPGAAVVVVVDVLSFTTTLTVAVARGIDVRPCDPAAAAATAGRHDATLAVGRSEARPGEISLSPQTLLHAPPEVRRLVLPSPNGSAISAALAGPGATVVGVSLRNFPAAAAWVQREAAGRPVAVVAAGERWPDGSLRPAVEDLWGAGAFIGALAPSAELSAELSPEAGAARAAFEAVAGRLREALPACGSGRELVVAGFGGDLAVAAEVAASDAVPVLRDGWFVDGGSARIGPAG